VPPVCPQNVTLVSLHIVLLCMILHAIIKYSLLNLWWTQFHFEDYTYDTYSTINLWVFIWFKMSLQHRHWTVKNKTWHVWRHNCVVPILANNQHDALFMYLFISSLYMFRASQCWSSSLLTSIPSSHLHRLIIPDDVLIQFDLLTISTVMLETCREMK